MAFEERANKSFVNGKKSAHDGFAKGYYFFPSGFPAAVALVPSGPKMRCLSLEGRVY